MSEERAWHIFVAICVAGMLFVVGFGIFAATGGLGPSKAERIDRLEKQVADLQTRVKALEQK